MFQLPTKLIALETFIVVIFLVCLVMGCVNTFGSYRHDKHKKQAGFLMLGSAGFIASFSVMVWILEHLKDQSDNVMSATSLIEGLRELIKTR